MNRKEDPIETHAFFIESFKSIEKRLNLDELQADEDSNLKTYRDISENWLNISQEGLHEAFQHLIRNYDWVIFYAEPIKTFFSANIKFFYNEKDGFPFPHDFDLAGVVTWDYESFKDRYGEEDLCKKAEMKKAFLKILGGKDEYFQLLDSDTFLSLSYKNRLTEYLDQFETVDDFCIEMD